MPGLIVDTETNNATDSAECIELAYGPISNELRTLGVVTVQRFKPRIAIEHGAMATHHILPHELVDEPASTEARLPECSYIIGHNIDFDWKVLGKPPVKRICTLALCRSALPSEDSHTLGAMLYYFLEYKQAREMLKSAHSAGADVMICNEVLQCLLMKHYPQAQSLEMLWQVSEEARVPKVWAFGKFKGEPFGNADAGYMSWCLKQATMDEYVKIACRRHLGK